MLTTHTRTGADVKPRPFWSDDVVTHIRRWAMDQRTALDPSRESYKVGSALHCELQIRDELGLVSREHAVISWEQRRWVIQDRGSKNGTWVDDMPAAVTTLQPGSVIRIGDVKFVAESYRTIALRDLFGRVLGWTALETIDNALQRVRELITEGAPLILEGKEDLQSVAARIHHASLGRNTPFYTYSGGPPFTAVALALGGTLCIPRATRESIGAFLGLHRDKDPEFPRLILCARTPDDTQRALGSGGALGVVTVPSLMKRREEMQRLVLETTTEIAKLHEISLQVLTPYDRLRFREITFANHKDLYSTLERLVLVRGKGVAEAAMLVGRTHSTVSEWMKLWMSPTSSTPS